MCIMDCLTNLFLFLLLIFTDSLSSFKHEKLIASSVLQTQQEETVTKRTKLPSEEGRDVSVTRSRWRLQEHHCDIIGEQFWQEHPDILEHDSP